MLVLRSCDHYALGGALELSFYLIVVFIFTLFVQSINRSKFKYSFNLFFHLYLVQSMEQPGQGQPPGQPQAGQGMIQMAQVQAMQDQYMKLQESCEE